MKSLRLNLACGLYDRVLPLYTGEVPVDGVDLNFIAVESPREVFDRFTASDEFDAAEFSITEFVARLSMNECPFVAIPVFPSRAFRHGAIAINRKQVKKPSDLAGKRIGVPLYSMTAAVWIRGHLQHDYGVDLSSVTWVEGSLDSAAKYGNPNVMPLTIPAAIEAAPAGESLGALLARGDIACTIGTNIPTAMRTEPDIVRMFPNYPGTEESYFRRTGVFPIMHLIAIRKSIYEQAPFLAQSLYHAFCRSKDIAARRMRDTIALRYMLPWLPDHIERAERVFGNDPWPFGIEKNRPTLETLMKYLFEQGLTNRRISIEEVFVEMED